MYLIRLFIFKHGRNVLWEALGAYFSIADEKGGKMPYA